MRDAEGLQTKLDIDFTSGRYFCDCIRYNEELEEKKLPSVSKERQINGLREGKNQLIEEIETHLEALKVAKDWHNRKSKNC